MRYNIYRSRVVDAKEDDIEWITVRGRHIPIKKGQSKEDAIKEAFSDKGEGGQEKLDKGKSSVKIYKNAMKKVREFKAKTDGTYDFKTGKPKDYPNGYSVSFHQNEPDKDGKWKSDYGRYSEEDYDRNVEELVKESDGELNIGYFSGTPEVSVWVKDLDVAKRLMKKHNQKSIWDWKEMDEIPNPKWNPKKNPMKE